MIDTEHIIEFSRLFRGRDTHYGLYYPQETSKIKRAKTCKGKITTKMWQSHLEGQEPFLGVVPITDGDGCYFGVIDFDYYAADHADLAKRVKDKGLPLVVCRSKSGGAHLFLFSADRMSAELVREKLSQFASMLGLDKIQAKENEKNPVIEIFPKQAKTAAAQCGSWINLPYWGGDKTERYAVDSDGRQLKLKDFLAYAESKAITAAMLAGAGGVSAPSAKNIGPGAPPCLDTLNALPNNAQEKGNTYLFNAGIYLKMWDSVGWQKRLVDMNADLTDPMSEPDLAVVLRSLENGTFAYQCGQPPLNQHCDHRTCTRRTYGVGNFGGSATTGDTKLPSITELEKLETDPPLWSLKVDDKVVRLITDDLVNPKGFQKRVMEQCSIVFPVMKQDVWQGVIRTLMQDVKVVAAPEDAGIRGQFLGEVRSYLALYRRSESNEAVLRGLPWRDTESDSVYFKGAALTKFLKDTSIREYSKNQIWSVLKEAGAIEARLSVAEKTVTVWSMPYAFLDEQTTPFNKRRASGGNSF